MTNTINPEHGLFYQYLEDLRASGVTNMYGASQYLIDDFDLDKGEAKGIHLEWMQNYNEILAAGLMKINSETE